MINGDSVCSTIAIDLKNWFVETIIVPFDEQALAIKRELITLCEKYVKLLSEKKPFYNFSAEEVHKRRKILSELKCVPGHVREILNSTLSSVIFLYKAVEEICFHGLRSCQRYIIELQFAKKEVEGEICDILSEKEYQFTLSAIEKLIGPYFKKYELLSHFLKSLDSTSAGDNITYSHPKFKYLECITKAYFETFKKGVIIVLCESLFCKLEVCNFLVKFRPLIRPMIFLSNARRNEGNKEVFSQKSREAVKEMYEFGLCNVLVTDCKDLQEINFKTADFLIDFDVEQHSTNYDVLELNEKNLHQKLVLFINEKLGKSSDKVSFIKNMASLASGVSLGENSDGKRKYIDFGQSCAIKKFKNELVQKTFMKKNCFESGFDSFEFDDGFLMKVDAEVKKDGGRSEAPRLLQSKSKSEGDSFNKLDEGKSECKPKLFSEFNVSIGDLNESDFDFDIKVESAVTTKPSKNLSPSFNQKKNDGVNCFIDGLSPIHGAVLSKNFNGSFSSTPLRKNESTAKLENEKGMTSSYIKAKDSVKETDYKYIDADLFEDWNDDDFKVKKVEKDEGDMITLSQAEELIKEAESAKESIETDEELNRSVDLLTGEVIRPVAEDIGNLFSESFNLPKAEKDQNESFLVVEEPVEKKQDSPSTNTSRSRFNSGVKPTVAQKLDFGESNCSNLKDTNDKCSTDKQNLEIYFISDDDFDEFSEDCFEAEKNFKSEKCKSSSVVNKSRKSVTPLKETDSADESINLIRKRGKCRIVESDTTEDSPSPLFRRNIRKKSKKTNCQLKEFIDLEAEVSDEYEVSSDEVDEEGEFEKSFLDEESYCTQNNLTDMTAKYLESLKNAPSHPGTFKIPKPKPYNPVEIFSQMPDDSNVDYELDSFCVNDVDEEMKSELSDLEIAEKVLEMDRRKKKKKQKIKYK